MFVLHEPSAGAFASSFYWNETKAFKNGVYLLAKQLVEQLAKLHLPALGAVLNVFAQEHADCIDVIIHLSMSIQGQVDSLCRSTPAQNPS